MTAYDVNLHQSAFIVGQAFEKLWVIDKTLIDLAAAGLVSLHVAATAPADTTKIWLQPVAAGSTAGSAHFWDGAAWTTPLTRSALFSHLIFTSSVKTAHIGDAQVTLAKLQNFAAYSFLGNNTGASAVPTLFNSAALTEVTVDAPSDFILSLDSTTGELKKFKRRLAGNFAATSLTLWVRTDGDDTTGDGSANTAAKAFLTVDGAISYAIANYTLSGRALIIRLGLAGTYAGFTLNNYGFPYEVYGDDAAQDSYIIGTAGGGSTGHVLVSGAAANLHGMRVSNPSTGKNALLAVYGAQVAISDMTFIHATTGLALVESVYNAVIIAQSGLKFSSGATIGYSAINDGIVDMQGGGSHIQNVNTHTYSNVFAYAVNGGKIFKATTFTLTGSAIGTRYRANNYGLINVSGGGINIFPGNVAGTTSNGLYV